MVCQFGHFSQNFGNIHSTFPQVLKFVKGDFQNKMLSRATCSPLARYIEVGHFGCFDASIIMRAKVGDRLEGSI